MLPLRITASLETSENRSESVGPPPTVRWLRAVPSDEGPTQITAPSLSTPDGEPTEVLRQLAEACRYSSRELARFLGISQRQLQRIFRARLGCTPQAYLREERLQAAERLLHSASSVKEVAYALGFCQQSQFSRDFKERFGRRPSALQRASRLAKTSALV
jgi:AraC-like DNA-binding protein